LAHITGIISNYLFFRSKKIIKNNEQSIKMYKYSKNQKTYLYNKQKIEEKITMIISKIYK
jgi:hypothetical protein